MSTAQVPVLPNDRRPFLTFRGWILIVIGALVMVLLFASIFLNTAGLVVGEEFSPQTFSSREFHYYQIPGLKWRLSSTYVDSASGTLACSATISKHIASSVPNPRWDLISYRMGTSTEVRAEAAILVEYLRDSAWQASSPWVQWTNEHPTLAAELWPTVHGLAIHHGYSNIPELMDFAWSVPSVVDLKRHSRLIVQRFAAERVTFLNAADRKTEAAELLKWASSFEGATNLEASVK